MEEIIKKAKAGDYESLEKIIEDIYQNLYKLALFRLKNEMDAQDAVQNTNILIYKNIQNLKEEKYFKVWVTKILINECNKIYNKREETFDEIKDNIGIESNDYVENINSKLYIIKILNTLSEKNRDIMYLYINNYKIKEIAKILDMKENTIKTRIKRSKKYLKDNYKYDRQKGEITAIHKITKVLITSLLVILLASGLVYAAVIIINNIQKEKAEPIKFGRLKINMTDDEELIKGNMQFYDENIYTLRIKDFTMFKEKEKELSIQFEGNEIVNEDTFEKYEYEAFLVTFFDISTLNLWNVEPYEEKTKITFNYDKTNTDKKEQQSFCILIPKTYSKNMIEIEYKQKEPEKMPEGAITFKFREFYIENISEFENINLQYDKNQDIYYTKFLSVGEYQEIKKQLGIITEKELLDEDLERKNVILVFKRTSNKMRLYKFKIEEEKPSIYLQETEELYGNGITGMIVVLKNENYIGYNVFLKSVPTNVL